MPVTWVKATMLIRCNSALRGHSGVRLELIETILHLLRNGMTPIIPLRGSISASGDLTPLSYIAGVLEGNPDIFVRINNGPNSKVVTADEALKLLSLEPFILGPKEGLGLVNGTAASTAVACLSAHSTNKLILLSQILVALSCEALLGNASNYHPFISTARPHPGQTECASNILRFLRGSALADPLGQPEKSKPGLFQDRYALRGAPQWLGPQLEDLSLALSQLSLELNSTSDNPLICASSRTIHSGANFLATSISNSVEKTRLALQIAGKLLFALSSELINPALNRGLAPNLAADDPSLSFTIKGVDINLAAYMSELAFLANPVTTHVQSAECHNQSVNALALISARYTVQAAEVLAQMGAALLYVVCQALDLRVLHVCYLRCLREKLAELLEGFLGPGVDAGARESFVEDVYGKVEAEWNTSTALPLAERCDALAEAALPVLISHLQKHSLPLTTDTAVSFQFQLKELAHSTFITQRDQFFAAQNTPEFLGDASKRMYTFVREGLGVPFHRGLVEHPAREPGVRVDGRERKSVGSWVSVVFAAVEDDRIWGPMCDILG
jgi:phenylalanine ammonia-lyase